MSLQQPAYLQTLPRYKLFVDAGLTGFPSDMTTSCGPWPGPWTGARRGAASAAPSPSRIGQTSRKRGHGHPCNKRQYNTINPTQRLTLTGHKVITRSRSRARTSINRLSLHSPSSSSMRRSPNNCPRYPRGRLLVVKHRQQARQVGACGAIAIKSSTDLTT
jgi:hypothetical protein